jgi:transposase
LVTDLGARSSPAAAKRCAEGFNNRRQLASYVGFAPSPFQSGSVAHDQGISKAGNRKGRTTGIELAWLWLRYQPDSDLSVWFRTRVGTTKGRIRRIAIVALARKLAGGALANGILDSKVCRVMRAAVFLATSRVNLTDRGVYR